MNEPTKPEVCVATSVCPRPDRWHCYDEQATEVEVLDFLYAMVVMLKPDVVLETGCYYGYGTERLARGCRDNGYGVVWTCDVQSDPILRTNTRLAASALQAVTMQCTGLELIAAAPEGIGVAFLDSGPDENRCHELRAILPKMTPGGIVAVHDHGTHGFLREKYLPPLLRELGLQYIYMDTPRGIALCRKQPEIYP
jgi:predicted O-methyltransferase YrrM